MVPRYLHFSVPDEGSLTDFEDWMPDFMEGVADGIEKSRSLIRGAVSDVAGDMVFSPHAASMQGDGGSGGETEAGTRQRDVVRLGVRSIAVKFSVTPKWLKLLTGFKQQEKIAVDYFDTEALEIVSTEMYIDGYKAVRKADTSYKGLWEVSFTLKEF